MEWKLSVSCFSHEQFPAHPPNSARSARIFRLNLIVLPPSCIVTFVRWWWCFCTSVLCPDKCSGATLSFVTFAIASPTHALANTHTLVTILKVRKDGQKGDKNGGKSFFLCRMNEGKNLTICVCLCLRVVISMLFFFTTSSHFYAASGWHHKTFSFFPSFACTSFTPPWFLFFFLVHGLQGPTTRQE